MIHPRTFALGVGCPFSGSETFPGCARWQRCVAATLTRGTWIVAGCVPELDVEDKLARCFSFQDSAAAPKVV